MIKASELQILTCGFECTAVFTKDIQSSSLINPSAWQVKAVIKVDCFLTSIEQSWDLPDLNKVHNERFDFRSLSYLTGRNTDFC